MRTYRVFRLNGRATWIDVGEYEAHGPEAARQAAAAVVDEGGTYSAVPERNWHVAVLEKQVETLWREAKPGGKTETPQPEETS